MGTILIEIKQSEDRIRQLQSEAEKIKFDLAVEQAVLARLRAVSDTPASTGAGLAKVPGSIASRIEEAMLVAGGPMNVITITEVLEKAGVTSESASGLKPSVASSLSRRRDLFVKVGKGEWDLVSRQKAKESHATERISG